MKNTRLVTLPLLAVLLVSCAAEKPVEEETRHAEAEASGSHDAAGAPGTVRIDPEMLRDLRVTTTAAEIRDGGELVTGLGEVGVNEEAYAEVGSPIAARVIRLLASPGDAVRKGQALAELQSGELGRARAAYRSAKGREELAATSLRRKRELAAERIAPAREVQEAEEEENAAAAEVQAAESALRALGVDTGGTGGEAADPSHLLLRSPIAGIIIERHTALGQIADPARALFRVGDLSRLWLTIHAFERDAVRVPLGARTRVAFPALPGRDFYGKVTFIGRQVDAGSRTIPIRVEIANESGVLRPGMSATTWLPVGDAAGSILSVPSACLQRIQQSWYVFLPREKGLFEMRQVGRGRDLGGEVEILSGLAAGEMVVVEGAFLLKAEAEKSRGEGEHHEH